MHKKSNQPNTQKATNEAKKEKQWKFLIISQHIKKHSQHVSQYVGQQLYYFKSSNKNTHKFSQIL
jgi:hypothetical protein